jgi:hypothetical protein
MHNHGECEVRDEGFTCHLYHSDSKISERLWGK